MTDQGKTEAIFLAVKVTLPGRLADRAVTLRCRSATSSWVVQSGMNWLRSSVPGCAITRPS